MKTSEYTLKGLGRLLKIDSFRKLLVSGLILILIIVHLSYVFIPLPRLFPLSNYTMFSGILSNKRLDNIIIRGITPDGNEVLLPIHKCFLPLDRSTLNYGIQKILIDKKRSDHELSEFFGTMVNQYEKQRVNGYHSCPEIHALNIYMYKWDWTNVEPKDVIPDTTLVYSTADDI